MNIKKEQVVLQLKLLYIPLFFWMFLKIHHEKKTSS